MNRACLAKNTNLHEQKQHASSIRTIKNNFVRMKKYELTLFALILLAGTSCHEKIDIEKEKKAIIAVIEEETNAALARDYDRFAANHVLDETNIRLGISKSGYNFYTGWEEIGSYFKEYFKNNPEPDTRKYEKINHKIKVYKDSAWDVHNELVYDSKGEVVQREIGVRFLEKVNGKWKIVYLSYLDIKSYEEKTVEGKEENMKQKK
jgi:hypothetical protein